MTELLWVLAGILVGGGQGDGGVVTAQGAMQRLCWN